MAGGFRSLILGNGRLGSLTKYLTNAVSQHCVGSPDDDFHSSAMNVFTHFQMTETSCLLTGGSDYDLSESVGRETKDQRHF